MGYCHLELILFIIFLLCGMLLKQVPYLLKWFCLNHSLGSCLWWMFLIWLSLNMFSYIFLGNQLLQATLWSCFAWSREYLKLSRISIYLSMAFNFYYLPYAYVLWIWSWIYLCNPPPRNISIHYLSWQVVIIFVVNILIIFTLALVLNCLILLPRCMLEVTLKFSAQSSSN